MSRPSAKSPVLNRTTLKGLRMIMEDEYPYVLQNFLDDSLDLHSGLHQAWEIDDREQFKQVAVQLSDACNSVGAETLVDVLHQTVLVCHEASSSEAKDCIQQLDEMFMDCRSAIQKELAKVNKQTA